MSTKDEIFDYVMDSPENTNPSVLKSLLNNLETSASGPFIIKFIYNGEEGWYITDVSFNEIEEAFQQGRSLYCKFVDYCPHGEIGTLYPLFYWEPSDADTKIYFHCPWGELYVSNFVDPSTGSITIGVTPYDEYYTGSDPELLLSYMPDISNSSMYNKVLYVDQHGCWTLKDISDLTQ